MQVTTSTSQVDRSVKRGQVLWEVAHPTGSRMRLCLVEKPQLVEVCWRCGELGPLEGWRELERGTVKELLLMCGGCLTAYLLWAVSQLQGSTHDE